ncbi:MAG: hypothetical protein ACRD6W_04640, partial [Nitrososphaerales archaeon]
MSYERFAALRPPEPTPGSKRAIERPNHEPLSQAVYRRLRQEIISGLLRPNKRLVETDLAQLFE